MERSEPTRMAWQRTPTGGVGRSILLPRPASGGQVEWMETPTPSVAERLIETGSLPVDEAYLSTPQHKAFPTSGGRTAYGWYYPPTNPDVVAPEGTAPPLVVMLHGGPTSQARTSLSLQRQAFTSRGFAVMDVDYGGSTGYGRAFREQLHEQWGVVDVDDCAAAATWLAEQGLADSERLAIRGGSAGGYTTLATLCFKDVFSAGTSFYGLGDLEAFVDPDLIGG